MTPATWPYSFPFASLRRCHKPIGSSIVHNMCSIPRQAGFIMPSQYRGKSGCSLPSFLSQCKGPELRSIWCTLATPHSILSSMVEETLCSWLELDLYRCRASATASPFGLSVNVTCAGDGGSAAPAADGAFRPKSASKRSIESSLIINRTIRMSVLHLITSSPPCTQADQAHKRQSEGPESPGTKAFDVHYRGRVRGGGAGTPACASDCQQGQASLGTGDGCAGRGE